jgi:ribosomal protein S18 acetylase RimI-like enzyme
MTTIDVRPAVAGDHPALLRLEEAAVEVHAAALPEVFHAGRSTLQKARFARLISSPSVAVLVAQVGQEVVGFAIVRLLPSSFAEKLLVRLAGRPAQVADRVRSVLRSTSSTDHGPNRAAFIDMLTVAGAWREQGIGRTLGHATLDWAREHGAHTIELEAYEFNRGALSLYKELGLETVRRRMRRSLPSAAEVDPGEATRWGSRRRGRAPGRS